MCDIEDIYFLNILKNYGTNRHFWKSINNTKEELEEISVKAKKT